MIKLKSFLTTSVYVYVSGLIIAFLAAVIIFFDNIHNGVGEFFYDLFMRALPIFVVSFIGYKLWHEQKRVEREWEKVDALNRFSLELSRMLHSVEMYKFKYSNLIASNLKEDKDPVIRIFKTSEYSVAHNKTDTNLGEISGFIKAQTLSNRSLNYNQISQVIHAYDMCELVWKRRDELAADLFNKLRKNDPHWRKKRAGLKEIITHLGASSFEDLIIYNQQCIILTDYLYDAIVYILENFNAASTADINYKDVFNKKHLIRYVQNHGPISEHAVDFDFDSAEIILGTTKSIIENKIMHNLPLSIVQPTQPWNRTT